MGHDAKSDAGREAKLGLKEIGLRELQHPLENLLTSQLPGLSEPELSSGLPGSPRFLLELDGTSGKCSSLAVNRNWETSLRPLLGIIQV